MSVHSLAQVDTVVEQANGAPVPDDLVSVTVSVYNYARFLPECLDSIAAQRHGPLELIVVDDMSTKDDSLAVAQAWMQRHADRFVRSLLLRHRRNQGLAQARNTAFTRARGNFVFLLDADNVIYPRAISRLHQAAEGGGFGAAYTQLEFFGNESRLGHADIWQPDWFRGGNYVDAMALVSRRAWRDVGGYSAMEAAGWEDFDFWCKFIEQGYTAAFVPEILCRYRVHGTSMLRTETRQSYDALFAEMTLRHPWLSLAPITDP